MKYTNKSKKGGNVMKKILSVLMSFCTLFFIPIGKVNAESSVNVLVVCEKRDIFDNFNNYMKMYKRENAMVSTHSKGYPYIFEGGEIRVNLIPLITGEGETISQKELFNCCQAIILYDISDESLSEIERKKSCIYGENTWREVLNVDTYLNNCIRMLTEEMEPCSWFRAFNFFSYNNAPQFGERREILNDHTLFLETRINVSGVTSCSESRNTWGRGHANYLCSAKSFLDSLFGDLNAFVRFKSQKGIENARVGIEDAKAGIDDAKAGIDDAKAGIENAKAGIDDAEKRTNELEEELKILQEKNFVHNEVKNTSSVYDLSSDLNASKGTKKAKVGIEKATCAELDDELERLSKENVTKSEHEIEPIEDFGKKTSILQEMQTRLNRLEYSREKVEVIEMLKQLKMNQEMNQEQQQQLLMEITGRLNILEQRSQNDPAFLKFLRAIKDYVASLFQ